MHEIIGNKFKRHHSDAVIEKAAIPNVRGILADHRVSETQRILKALEDAKGNQTEAAKLLGISRVTLWRKIKNMENISL